MKILNMQHELLKMNSVSGIKAHDPLQDLAKGLPDSNGKDFASFVDGFIESVDRDQKVADHRAIDLASGKSQNLHQTMIDMEKANLSFQLMVQVRNKGIEAYQEMMRMQV